MAAKTLQARIKAGDQKAIKQALANPAWRRYVTDPKQLAGAGKVGKAITARRALKARLDAPITAGSTVTERDLAHQAKAEAQVRYGPQEAELQQTLGETQQRASDTGSFYDQYMAQLQAHQKAVQDIGAQTSQQLQGTLAGVTGLSAANLTDLQNPAVADARARGATAGDLSQMASNAATTRQALLGSFAAQQAVQDQANTIYAAGQAGAVAPAQKLSAQAQAQGKVADVRKQQTKLAGERAAWDEAFRQQTRQQESKTVLAQQIANVGAASKAADIKLRTGAAAETVRSHKAGEAAANARIQAAKDKSAADAASKGTTPNKYGITTARWNGMSEADRQQVIKDFGATGRSKSQTPAQIFEGKYGVKPVTTQQANQAQGSIAQAKTWLKTLGGNLDEAGQTLSAGQPAGTDEQGNKVPAVPKINAIFVRVAMDQRRMNGYISAGTADRLHRAGYSVAQLGLKTKPLSVTQRNTTTYGNQGNLGQTGHK